MINNIINTLFDVFFSIARGLNEIFLSPIIEKILDSLPNLNSFLESFNLFLINYVFKGILFIKEVFLNITGLPRQLWTNFIGCLFLLISACLACVPLLFIANGIRTIKKGIL